MQIRYRNENGRSIALVEADSVIFNTVQDMLDVMVGCSWDGAEIIVIEEKHLLPEFFELKSGIAGEMLQKFSNYRLRLGIIGDFSKYDSKSLRDFIRESNRSERILFVESEEDLLRRLG
ncbi:hypothetical protein SDC9_48055 [bioreactor metagenome]|uniref:DUF4180 domain-containing protein n=1 Tax=bioreactor metagenome TaxID=1076179 RepID=A0A644WDA5_9ZZZZ